MQLETNINRRWIESQALKAPMDRRGLKSRFRGRVLDVAVLKEMYEARKRADAKKQKKRNKQVVGKSIQKGKKVV